jgi:hypothetical protein
MSGFAEYVNGQTCFLLSFIAREKKRTGISWMR